MDNKITKKDINDIPPLFLLNEDTAEEMLEEYAYQMYDEEVFNPLSGIHNNKLSGLALNVENGLEFMHVRSRIPRDMTLIRKSRDSKDTVAIYFFYGSSFDYFVENKMEQNVSGFHNGIIIHNYSSNVKISLFKDQELNFTIVRIRKSILYKYFRSLSAELEKMLFTNTPILIYEHLDQKTLDHLRLMTYLHSTMHTSKHLIFAKSIELLALVFNLLLTRRQNESIQLTNINYDHIFNAKNFLLKDWQNPPTIRQLSKFMGMSPTRAKAVFKQVFGYPPHNYLKRKKMEAAYDLVINSGHNITEIGRQLGYKNMSHFSADFKKYHGITPKKLKAGSRIK